MECPVYYCIGNHDLVKGEYGEQLFESIYGPTWFSFEYGKTHYIVTPMPYGDYDPSYDVEEVYNWLKDDLEQVDPDKTVIVFNHNILTHSNDFLLGPEAHQMDLRKHNLKAWIYGHWHINYVRNQGGIYTSCTSTLDKGGIDHSASAFRTIHVAGNGDVDFNLHYCYIVEPQAVVVTPVSGTSACLLPSGEIPLSVNAYHSGSTVRDVSYTLCLQEEEPDSKLQPLTRLSGWNWFAKMTPSSSWDGRWLTVSVTTRFSDDKTFVNTFDFLYNSSVESQINLKDNWLTLLGNAQHTGVSSGTLQPPLRLVWLKNIGANIFMSSPLIVDNKIIVASCDDNGKPINGIFALDANSGTIIWKYRTRNSIKNSIAFDGGFVFAQDSEGNLYAVDINTGKLQWEKNVADDNSSYIEEGLTAENGVVYAGTRSGLSAFRVEDGLLIWKNTAWKANEGATTTLTIGNGILTAGAQWGGLYGNDLKTGAGLWKVSQDGMSNRGASTVLQDGHFYVISQKSIFILDPQTGEIIRKKEIPERSFDVTSTPLVTDNEIIFGTADKGVLALDKHSLDIIWNTPTRQSLVYTAPHTTTPFATVETSPVLSGNTVYFGASDGYLYGLDLKTGEIRWKMQTGAPSFASVAISGNLLVAVDFSGNVYAFIPGSGEPVR